MKINAVWMDGWIFLLLLEPPLFVFRYDCCLVMVFESENLWGRCMNEGHLWSSINLPSSLHPPLSLSSLSPPRVIVNEWAQLWSLEATSFTLNSVQVPEKDFSPGWFHSKPAALLRREWTKGWARKRGCRETWATEWICFSSLTWLLSSEVPDTWT